MMGGERSIQLPIRFETRPNGLRLRSAAVLSLGLLLSVALMVAARRWAGALREPLDLTALSAAGFLIAAVAAGIRAAWFLPPPTRLSRRFDRFVMAATALAILLLGLSLSLPETPIAGKFVLCVLLAIEESAAWAWFSRRECSASGGQDDETSLSPAESATSGIACRNGERRTGFDESADDLPEDGEVVQQLTRSRSADGVETLSGWLRAPFAAGQRTGSVHVAFCPPFAATPEVEVEQSDGPEARIKVAQLLPYGVRFDLKLAATAQSPADVLVHFSAVAAVDAENSSQSRPGE